MSDIALKIENVSKLYALGQVGTGTLSRDFERWFARVRGKEDPYLKIGQVNDRTKKMDSDFVWALQDINFEVKKGEVLGVIGRNGAGKSTLLKILSKITQPTKGRIYIDGRIASLLEVGTGFHPELSGRENIYMNGAILGMRKWEIDKKFDEIVDFAGTEAYIDTPVKRYSSGMYVRLAFAVAAFLEPEILIVDEVLAVGDAEFQKKCLGRMHDVSVNEGRTVLFVSHNIASLATLCNTGVLLKNGMLERAGKINEIISHYINSNKSTLPFGDESVRIDRLYANEEGKHVFFNGSDLLIHLEYTVFKKMENLGFCFALRNEKGEDISIINTYHVRTEELDDPDNGQFRLTIKIDKYILNDFKYFLTLHVNDQVGNIFYILQNVFEFEIADDNYRRGGSLFRGGWQGAVCLVPEISVARI